MYLQSNTFSVRKHQQERILQFVKEAGRSRVVFLSGAAGAGKGDKLNEVTANKSEIPREFLEL